MANIGSGSGSSYPSAFDTQTSVEVNSPNSNKTIARAEVPNDLAACIMAVQQTLGTNPQGSTADVKTLLQIAHGTDGIHKSGATFPSPVISSPTITGTIGGTPALGNGTTATTQAIDDSTTKVATTAFVLNQINAIPSGIIKYLTAGSYSWTAPDGVTNIFISGCAGGGGGGGVQYNSPSRYGGGGGAGAAVARLPLTVTPGNSYAITIGAAGVGGIANGQTAATAGGNTTFGNLLTLAGGSPGQDAWGAIGGGAGGLAGTGGITLLSSAGADGSVTNGTGGGGNCVFGNGGAGRTDNGAGNDATYYGSGGGGAREAGNIAFYYNGGSGTQGYLILEW